MEWYKSLNVNMKINAKECFILLTGMDWHHAGKLFSMRERINIMYDKLRIEGFAV